MTTPLPTVDVTDAALAAEMIGRVDGVPISAEAGRLTPGDYLPPQQCLASTVWSTSGFRVGRSPQAVHADAPDHRGRVLLLGPLGVLAGLPLEAVVHVIRPRRDPGRPGERRDENVG